MCVPLKVLKVKKKISSQWEEKLSMARDVHPSISWNTLTISIATLVMIAGLHWSGQRWSAGDGVVRQMPR